MVVWFSIKFTPPASRDGGIIHQHTILGYQTLVVGVRELKSKRVEVTEFSEDQLSKFNLLVGKINSVKKCCYQ